MTDTQTQKNTDASPVVRDSASGRLRISLLVGDLSSRGAGRWQGGVRPYLLSQALQQAGYAVEWVGFSNDLAGSQLETDAPIKTIPVESPRAWLGAIPQLLRSLQGDVIYAYKLKPSSFGLALLHRWFRHKPVILDIDDWELSWHGGDERSYRFSPRTLYRDIFKSNGAALQQVDHPLFLRWIEGQVGRANRITTHTSFLQERFGGVFLPNGKDTHRFDPSRYEAAACRVKYGLEPYRVLMFPGAPRPYKGVEDILEALDLLDDMPDLRLVIVGGSPYDDYDGQLRKRWGHRMIQLPKMAYSDMPEVIAAAHAVVVPQRDVPAAQAQFPLKLTDGMAMAKPILATRVGDIPSILGQTGYLVEPGAPAQLAEAIRTLFVQYPQALTKGQAARQRCIERYSIEAMSRILQTVLQPYGGPS